MIISVNEIENRPVAIDGKAEIRPMLNLNFIVDHRYVDGGRTKTLADKVALNLTIIYIFFFFFIRSLMFLIIQKNIHLKKKLKN